MRKRHFLCKLHIHVVPKYRHRQHGVWVGRRTTIWPTYPRCLRCGDGGPKTPKIRLR